MGIKLADVKADAKRGHSPHGFNRHVRDSDLFRFLIVRGLLWYKSPSNVASVGIGLENEHLTMIKTSYMLAPELFQFSFYAEVADGTNPSLFHTGCSLS